LLNQKVHDFYFSPDIISTVKSRRAALIFRVEEYVKREAGSKYTLLFFWLAYFSTLTKEVLLSYGT
jgi:hypothetical protein